MKENIIIFIYLWTDLNNPIWDMPLSIWFKNTILRTFTTYFTIKNGNYSDLEKFVKLNMRGCRVSKNWKKIWKILIFLILKTLIFNFFLIPKVPNLRNTEFIFSFFKKVNLYTNSHLRKYARFLKNLLIPSHSILHWYKLQTPPK